MKRTMIILSIITFFIIPVVVLAQEGLVGQEARQQNRVQDPTTNLATDTPQGNQIQNQNQIQTQNQNEDSQLQVNTQEQESLQINKPNSRSQTARENMSQVAQKVEELLAVPGYQGGIGDQVREIARAQRQAQTQIEGELDKLETRSGFVKRLFGPDYKAVKGLDQQIEQNRLRIQQLEQLINQVQNQAEQDQIQETIQALIEQNTALEEQIQAEEKTASLLGWLFRLFNR
ncbi:MAG: hypothetical protein PHX72_00270 [Candidatus Shapirobacteria bacterium]|nr:hypothetical protein [Candidatus Shapirobacteria bacterium]